MLQPNTLLQIAFRFKIGIHKLYLGTGEVGYLCKLGVSVTFDLIVSLAQAKVEVERQNSLFMDNFIHLCSLYQNMQTLIA